MHKLAIFSFVVFLITACNTNKSAYFIDKHWRLDKIDENKKPIESLFLVGDAGKLDEDHSNYVLEALKEELSLTQRSTLVYLGDNIYNSGMPEEKDSSRTEKEGIITSQIALAKHINGDTYFIPGNHDWNNSKSGGKEAMRRQEEFIESYFDNDLYRKVNVYPSDGCGDPKIVTVYNGLTYVFIDSQWWLQDWSVENGINQGCLVSSRDEFLKWLGDIITNSKNDHIVLFLHHPLISNGNHGGNYSFKQHVFPLTMLKNYLYLPLPVIGSLYPLYRKISGGRQDVQNGLNKGLTKALFNMAKNASANVTFVSGHEHNLQYFDLGAQKMIISGSGGKVSYSKRGGRASYSRAARGFARIDFYDKNEAWLSFYTVIGQGERAVLDYRTQLR